MSRRRATPAAQASVLAAAIAGPAAPPVVRVATYRRASTDETNQPYSLEVQDAALGHHVASQPGWVRVADYVERASGKDLDGRPELRRLLEAAGRGEFDVVLVMKLDRWSRRLVDVMATVDHLDKHAVKFKSATEPFDTSGPLGTMMLQLLAIFAEFERGLILERIRAGIAAKLATGVPLTGRVGYGLRVNADGTLAPDPDTIGVVRRIFAVYTGRQLGTRAIAASLNEAGIPGPGARGWSADSVSRVLRNRAFVGEIRHKDRWLPGAHEPIVDVELFDAATAILDLRSGDGAAAAATRGDYLLTGVLECPRCAGSFVGRSGTSRSGKVHRYYVCGTVTRYGPGQRCDAPNLPAEELEARVTDALLEVYADSALFAEAIAAHLAARADRDQPLQEQLTAVRAAIADKQRIRQRYQDDYEAGRLSAMRYEARAGELDEQLEALLGTEAELEAELDVTELPAAPTQAELNALHEDLARAVRAGSVPVRKALFAALIDRIEVHGYDDIRPTFRLYDPSAARAINDEAATAVAASVPAQRDGLADGVLFASRRPGWS